MLGVNQLDFLNYTTAFKGNYRKGVHKLRAILSTKTHAEEFAQNRGGVAVVLGVPVNAPDKNSDELLALLLGSSVADLAVETFLTCFYEFDDLNELLAVKANCQAIQANPLTWRAVSASPVAVGKLVATLAGLSCVSYANIAAIAANSTAMKAVAASSTAMAAVIASPTALSAVVSSSTAMAAVAASSVAIRAVVASSTAKTALIAQNSRLQSVAATWWNTVQSGFTLVRAQKDDDGVTAANSTNASYIMFAIPGGFQNGGGITNCFHGHNGAAAGSASGSYSDTAKREVLLGGGTFTETGDGMVRTWIYSI